MKRITINTLGTIIFTSLLALIFCISCVSDSNSNSSSSAQWNKEIREFKGLVQKEDVKEAESLLDSIKLKKEVPDSIIVELGKELSELNETLANREMAKKRLSELRAEEDEFKGVTFYRDKSSPKYANQNGIFLYFGVNEQGNSTGLRFKVQYFADDWLFIEKLTFLLDGEKVEYAPGEWERDNDSDIWEYNDSPVDKYSFQLIKKIVESKEAKVRFVGQQYYKDKIITSNQKAAMRRVLEIYTGIFGEHI